MQKKKVKISNVKRSQHLKNKKNFTKPLKKKEAPKSAVGVGGKKQSNNKTKVFGKPAADERRPRKKHNQNGLIRAPPPAVIEGEDCDAEDFRDMLEDDEDDQHDVPANEGVTDKKRKRNALDEDQNKSAKHFEQQYAAFTHVENSTAKRIVNLLPIKTKYGEVVSRTTEIDYNSEDDAVEPEDGLEKEDDEDDEAMDSDDDIIKEDAVSSAESLCSLAH